MADEQTSAPDSGAAIEQPPGSATPGGQPSRPNGSQQPSPHWRVTPPPAASRRPTAACVRGSTRAAQPMGDAGRRRRRSARDQPLGVVGRAQPEPHKDPLQPDVHHAAEHGQHQLDLQQFVRGRRAFSRRRSATRRSEPAKDFSTQIPSFVDNTALYNELTAQKVTINAQNPNAGSIGHREHRLRVRADAAVRAPVHLHHAPGRLGRRRRRADVVRALTRAACGGGGSAGHVRGRRRDRRGQGGAHMRSSTSSGVRTSTWRSAPRSRAACC